MNPDDSLIDRNRSARLCTAGLPGWTAATVIGPDGSETLLLVAESAIGRQSYNAECADVAHEQCGPLPARIAASVGLVCGAPSRSKGGRPCRNRVAAQGQRCQWHKKGTQSGRGAS